MLSLLGILKAGRTLQKFGNLKWIFRLKLGGWTRNQGYCRGGACIHSSFPKSHWGYVWAEDSIPLAVEMLQTCPGPPACSRDLSVPSTAPQGWGGTASAATHQRATNLSHVWNQNWETKTAPTFEDRITPQTWFVPANSTMEQTQREPVPWSDSALDFPSEVTGQSCFRGLILKK